MTTPSSPDPGAGTSTRRSSPLPAGWPVPHQGGPLAPAPVPGSAEQRNHLDACLAEYGSLRQESLQAISNRIQIMNFAFTSLAIVLAALLTSHASRIVLIPFGLIFVPMASKASTLIWLGEYNRSQRAGRGIAELEHRVNILLGNQNKFLQWETSLISARTHMGYPYVATVAFILSTGICGEILGGIYVILLASSHGPMLTTACAVLTVGYAVAFESLFIRFFRKRWIAIRTYSNPG